MSVRKSGSLVVSAIRVLFVLLMLTLLFLLGRSSLNLISAFAVPFGFSSGTSTAFSVVAVVFFASIGALLCLYFFNPSEKGRT